MDTLFDSVITNSKFLYSSFYGYTNQDVIDFFENIGVQTKTERGERVFPQSDHSSDVIRALEAEMRRLGVHIHLHTGVKQVISKLLILFIDMDFLPLSCSRNCRKHSCRAASGY